MCDSRNACLVSFSLTETKDEKTQIRRKIRNRRKNKQDQRTEAEENKNKMKEKKRREEKNKQGQRTETDEITNQKETKTDDKINKN